MPTTSAAIPAIDLTLIARLQHGGGRGTPAYGSKRYETLRQTA